MASAALGEWRPPAERWVWPGQRCAWRVRTSRAAVRAVRAGLCVFDAKASKLCGALIGDLMEHFLDTMPSSEGALGRSGRSRDAGHVPVGVEGSWQWLRRRRDVHSAPRNMAQVMVANLDTNFTRFRRQSQQHFTIAHMILPALLDFSILLMRKRSSFTAVNISPPTAIDPKDVVKQQRRADSAALHG